MDPVTVSSQDAPAAIGPYAQAIVSGGFVFTSGQIPLDPRTGQMEAGDIRVQTRRVLENLRAVLSAAGSSPTRVVKATVYLADLGDFADMNAVYAEFFGGATPARSTIQAAGLPRGARVEIDLIAAL